LFFLAFFRLSMRMPRESLDIGHDRLLPYPFQFFIHWSFNHSKLLSYCQRRWRNHYMLYAVIFPPHVALRNHWNWNSLVKKHEDMPGIQMWRRVVGYNGSNVSEEPATVIMTFTVMSLFDLM
jgi:hypothetical protein